MNITAVGQASPLTRIERNASALLDRFDTTHIESPAIYSAPIRQPITVVEPDKFVDAAQLKSWQAVADSFKTDGVAGLRPTGSPAQKAYTAWLAEEFGKLGATVSIEPYSFQKWTPASWSLETSAGPVAVANYIPWSGQTGPNGVRADLVYLPTELPAVSQQDMARLNTPEGVEEVKAALRERFSSAIQAQFVQGKTVVVDLPRTGLPFSLMGPVTYYKNDPDGTAFGPGATTGKDGSLTNMLVIPALQEALALAGASGMVGILDLSEPQARGAYYPFFGLQVANMPGVFIDRDEGRKLKQAIAAAGGALPSTLVVDASFNSETDHNVTAVVDAPGRPEIVISSHTDGTNSLEDNGPAAMLAMARYFAAMPVEQRPARFRFVLTGGHFVGSAGIREYIRQHAEDLSAVRAIIEIEHLGAREWEEDKNGVPRLTGKPEPQILLTNLWPMPIGGSDAAQAISLRRRSTEFAQKFPRSLVIGPFPVGEGLWWHYPMAAGVWKGPYPSIQFITNPGYLLNSGKPVTEEFTDYNLMRAQTIALTQMAVDLSHHRFW